jgi:ribonuclease-3
LGLEAPAYAVHSVGPDHEKEFTATVTVGGITTSGVGRSKKSAEQVAAEEASYRLGELLDGA